ncbi:MAG: flagellar biosynthetic protein FliO [Pirellulales bacterium]
MNTQVATRMQRRHEIRRSTLRAVGVYLLLAIAGIAVGNAAAASAGERPAARGLPVQFRPASQSRAGETADAATAAPLPLAPSKRQGNGDREAAAQASPLRGGLSTFGSLCLIVGAGATIVWILRRQSPTQRGRLPTDVIESLGALPLNPRLEVHLLRVGGKLLLVGSTASSLQTLVEINDAEEVARLTAACHAHRASSVGASVRQALARLDSETSVPNSTSPRGRRFSTGVADA